MRHDHGHQAQSGDTAHPADDDGVGMGRSYQDITFNHTTYTGSADDANDYNNTSGTDTIPAGDSNGVISIPITIKGDHSYETDETFSIKLDNINAAAKFNGGATDITGNLKIIDDDPPPYVYIVAADDSVDEDAGPMDFLVKLCSDSTNPAGTPIVCAYDVVVNVALDQASATKPEATAGTDFTAPATTVTIPAGDPFATVSII